MRPAVDLGPQEAGGVQRRRPGVPAIGARELEVQRAEDVAPLELLDQRVLDFGRQTGRGQTVQLAPVRVDRGDDAAAEEHLPGVRRIPRGRRLEEVAQLDPPEAQPPLAADQVAGRVAAIGGRVASRSSTARVSSSSAEHSAQTSTQSSSEPKSSRCPCSRCRSRSPMLMATSPSAGRPGSSTASMAALRCGTPAAWPHSQAVSRSAADGATTAHGSTGSWKSVSRSQPSFSTFTCWIAIALAFASRSGIAWYSDTQQRKILYFSTG